MATFVEFDEYIENTFSDKEVKEMKEYANQVKKAYKLSQLRQSLNINQNELAEKMGVSQANISKIERGEGIQMNTMEKYINALGCKLNITAEMPNGDVVIC